MHRRALTAAILTTLCLTLNLGARVAPASAMSASRGPVAGPSLQTVMDEAVQQGSPGALAQSRAGHRAHTGDRDRGRDRVRDAVAGAADIRTGQPPAADMRFRIGSVTKTFVATVILQLVAEHRLRLDDTVAHVLPGLMDRNGNDGAAITIRMLLNDTSGLYEYTDDPRIEQIVTQDPAYCFTLRELVDAAIDHPPYFAPGASWAYSNTNYSLLSMIIGQVAGRPYGEEITRRILRPLGLSSTSLPGCSPLLPGPRLHGYTERDTAEPTGSPEPLDPRIQDVTDYNPSFAAGNGDMISTVGDLNRFDSALLRGRLLPARLLRQQLTPTPGSFPGSDTFRYGLGVVIAQAPCGVTVYGNAGLIQGYQTWTSATRDGRHSLTFVLNNDWLDPTNTILQALTAEFCTRR